MRPIQFIILLCLAVTIGECLAEDWCEQRRCTKQQGGHTALVRLQRCRHLEHPAADRVTNTQDQPQGSPGYHGALRAWLGHNRDPDLRRRQAHRGGHNPRTKEETGEGRSACLLVRTWPCCACVDSNSSTWAGQRAWQRWGGKPRRYITTEQKQAGTSQ